MEKRGKGDYPTVSFHFYLLPNCSLFVWIDDVLSDWDSQKDKQKKEKEAATGGKSGKDNKKVINLTTFIAQ